MPAEAHKSLVAKFEPPKIVPLERLDQLLMENAALKTELARARAQEAQHTLYELGQLQLAAILGTLCVQVPAIQELEDPQGIAARYRYNDQAKALMLIDIPQR